MSESVTMPALGESVTEGTVTTWLKKVGEKVEVDEPLLEVSTDKVDTEVPSPFAGVLEEILVEEDETVEVGAVLAKIGDGSGASGSDDSSEEKSEEKSDEGETPEAEEPEEKDEPAEKPSTDTEAPAKKPEADTKSAGGKGEAVTMPALGESVTEGTVTTWLKKEGDTVEVDEPLLEVSTDKVDTEVPSPVAGTVQKIVVDEDETVEVGATLCYIGDGSGGGEEDSEEEPEAEVKTEEPKSEEKAEEPEAEKKDEGKTEAAAAADQEEPEEDEEPKKSGSAEPAASSAEAPAEKPGTDSSAAYVTPLVRKLAADKGVDLSTLTGTGVGGRIRKQDVLEAAEKAAAPAAAPAQSAAPAAAAAPAAQGTPAQPTTIEPASDKRGTREKMSRLRQVISRRMVESLETSAQLTTVLEVDMTRIVALRAQAKANFQAQHGVNLTFLPFFVKAATEALRAYPKLNASIEGNEVVYHGAEHIGIAVDTERGLLVPVIKDAGDLTISGIAKKIADLAARTRDNKVGPDELGGSTFTITNTGSGGALFDTPIINQPEVGIMGTGTIVRRPVVVKDVDGNETIAIRSMCYLSISYDHRLVDGADASRFLSTVKRRLEEGAFAGELGL